MILHSPLLRSLLLLVLALPLSIASANGSESPMKAGVAKADITPPVGTRMWGYFDRLKGAEGTLDPLYARVLVLTSANKRLAYVDLDLGRTFGPASLMSLRTAAKQDSGIDYLIVQATHTHAGPIVQDVYPDGTPAWELDALSKIENAIHSATESAEPVRLGVGHGAAYIGYNRRRVEPDRTVSMLWSNSARVPTWPFDPGLTVLRIDRLNGDPLAILVNYATHPVTFGNDNMRFSADFPGAMCKVVEEAFGGKPLAFFVQGAPGDINVYDTGTSIKQDAVGRRDWAGKTLGDAAVEAAMQIRTEVEPESEIQFSEKPLPFRLRWDPAKFKHVILDEIGPTAFQIYSSPIQEEMNLPVTTALIARKFALVGMPGEPFLQFQTELRARCPVQDCFFLGYTNGYYGYFPTIKAAQEGGYGAVSATTWVEVGAGERMENYGITEIYRMLGRLEDAPNTHWKNLPQTEH